MFRSLTSALALLLLLMTASALADQNSKTLVKWEQMPDLATTSIDINVSSELTDCILADDFECTETSRITRIRVWGSWLQDDYADSPYGVAFTLRIHADIPADVNPGGYSIPGEVLWSREYQPGAFAAYIWAEDLLEGWMYPPETYIFPGDTVCWQYICSIPFDEAFLQGGTPVDPIVYWLEVKAEPVHPLTRFGWKTTLDHWNDDAVFAIGDDPTTGPWNELIYPPGHIWAGQSIDLAFALETEEVDCGDAPDAPGTLGYATLIANNGAYHAFNDSFYLGASWDSDVDGQPEPQALGDDNDGNDDEDGVIFNTLLVPGQPASIDVTVAGGGNFYGWIDYDIDGNWADATDQVFSAETVVAGINTLTFNVPPDAVIGTTFARFRLTPVAALISFDGHGYDGEVEDYRVEILPEPLDYGDAPDTLGTLGYATLLANDGARHRISATYYLGAGVDTEFDGQPEPQALGDDNDGNDDEDGVIFNTLLVPGQPASIDVTVAGGGNFYGWIDYDIDGNWFDATDQVFSAETVVAGVNTLTFNVPPDAVIGTTFARFRLTPVDAVISFDGHGYDGEVEDYLVTIADNHVMKWLQVPDLNLTGIDVAACLSPTGGDYLLADDFLCTREGPLTDFRIWGSWRNDFLPFSEDPTAVRFVLSIHEDLPAGVATPWSMPGEVLWWHEFVPGEFEVEMHAGDLVEGWLYPPDDYRMPSDWTCWLYGFHVDPHLAFSQAGSEVTPVVYWLDLKAYPLDPEAEFGWKTSVDHWNDDAVWTLGEEPYYGPWEELRYPPLHELFGQSIDLAFAIFEDLVTDVPDQGMPKRVGLHQNVPNPFNPCTRILYDMPSDGGRVRLDIFDVMGRRVRALVDGFVNEGTRLAVWDGLDDGGQALPTGVYFANLYMDGTRKTVKMVLLR
ncbi:hypothetical protein H8E07_21445 [bacterium]|nr:hypothetical protein [bacterium]